MATAFKTAPMTDAEWEARQQLAACYRIFAYHGWDQLIYTHISVRVPGEDEAFLLNPFGLHFSEVTASNLLKVDIDGNKLTDSNYPVCRAGFVQHSLFHRNLPDAHCIMHTHTTAGMAVASTKEGLEPLSFYAGFFDGKIAYHDFEGVTIRDEEGPSFLKSLGDKRFMILKNHGLVVMAETIPAAFFWYYMLERACQVQIAIKQAGTPNPIPRDVLDVHQRDMYAACPPGEFGKTEFEAMTRIIDKIDPSWRA
jgi:ribulose-5-phosphate 4-epimerase/fuculose-1-phosphate aldolase